MELNKIMDGVKRLDALSFEALSDFVLGRLDVIRRFEDGLANMEDFRYLLDEVRDANGTMLEIVGIRTDSQQNSFLHFVENEDEMQEVCFWLQGLGKLSEWIDRPNSDGKTPLEHIIEQEDARMILRFMGFAIDVAKIEFSKPVKIESVDLKKRITEEMSYMPPSQALSLAVAKLLR